MKHRHQIIHRFLGIEHNSLNRLQQFLVILQVDSAHVLSDQTVPLEHFHQDIKHLIPHILNRSWIVVPGEWDGFPSKADQQAPQVFIQSKHTSES